MAVADADKSARFAVFDGKIRMISELDTVLANDCAYEVIRIIKGVPVFLEDHYERLKNTHNLKNDSLEVDFDEILGGVRILANKENKANFNIKILSFFSNAKSKYKYIIYPSQFYYPTENEYNKGIYTSLVNFTRVNPEAKIVNNSYIEKIKKIKEEKRVFEVLLADENGEILEGSKSNVFFIKGKKVFTAPQNKVLSGITRIYVCKICCDRGIEVVESAVKASNLKDYDAVFITGTSIKILPVSKVDDMFFQSPSNKILIELMNAYDIIIEDYIKRRK